MNGRQLAGAGGGRGDLAGVDWPGPVTGTGGAVPAERGEVVSHDEPGAAVAGEHKPRFDAGSHAGLVLSQGWWPNDPVAAPQFGQ